jgi:hypothetical protein
MSQISPGRVKEFLSAAFFGPLCKSSFGRNKLVSLFVGRHKLIFGVKIEKKFKFKIKMTKYVKFELKMRKENKL